MKGKHLLLIIGLIISLAVVVFLVQKEKPGDYRIPGGVSPTPTPEEKTGAPENIQLDKSQNMNTPDAPKPTSATFPQSQPPTMQINPEQQYFVTLKTTEGPIKIRLKSQQTPKTVNNFVYLANQGFYNGTIFHRVIEGFMIQGGDPRGDGTGGPGYQFADEPFEGEYSRGTVAMANSGPNTNGSQFFIMHQDYDLPNNYVIFGQVVEGMATVDKIATAETTANAQGENSRPVKPVSITSAQVSQD